MKQCMLLITLLFSMAMVSGPSRDYFTAVENSDAMQMIKNEGNEVIAINFIKSINCPGCYQFDVLYRNEVSGGAPNKGTFYTKDNQVGPGIIVFRRDPTVRIKYPADCGMISVPLNG